jgi:hypothetical protein
MARPESVHLCVIEAIRGEYDWDNNHTEDLEICLARAREWQAKLGIDAAVTKAIDALLEKYKIDKSIVKYIRMVVCGLFRVMEAMRGKYEWDDNHLTEDLEICVVRACGWQAQLGIDAAVTKALDALLDKYDLDPWFVQSIRMMVCGLFPHIGVSKFLTKTYYESCFRDRAPDCELCCETITLQQFSLLQCGHYHCMSCTRRLIHCSQCRGPISASELTAHRNKLTI